MSDKGYLLIHTVENVIITLIFEKIQLKLRNFNPVTTLMCFKLLVHEGPSKKS